MLHLLFTLVRSVAPSAKKMNFLNLNYDVLLNIVEYLSLDDQINLWEVGEPTSNLNLALCHKWQREKKRELCGMCFEGKPTPVLHGFLAAVSGTLEQLTLNGVPKDQLEIWHKHRFPKMRALYFKECENGSVDETQIQILTECFPLLEAVTLDCRRMSRHLSNWKNLSYLDLRKCWNLSTECMEHVFGNLHLRVLKICQYQKPFPSMENRLQELEELEFGVLKEIIPGLGSLPRLRKFAYNAYYSDPWLSLRNIRHRIILSETTNIYGFYFSYMPAEWTYFQRVLNLTIVDAPKFMGSGLPIYTQFKYFPRLQRLHLHNLNMFENANQLWQMVDDCPELQTLIITKHVLSLRFFLFDPLKMRQVLRRRSEPLQLVFHQVNCNNLIMQFFRHPNLKIIFEAVDCAHIHDHLFELELLPLKQD